MTAATKDYRIPRGEVAVQKSILDYLARRPDVWAFRCQSGRVKVRGAWMSLAPAGTADIIGILAGGRALAIEVKAAKPHHDKAVIEAQRAFERMWAGLGGLYIEARSVEDVAAALKVWQRPS